MLISKKQFRFLERQAYIKSHNDTVDPKGKIIGEITAENSQTEFEVSTDAAHFKDYDHNTKRFEYQQVTGSKILQFRKFIGCSN